MDAAMHADLEKENIILARSRPLVFIALFMFSPFIAFYLIGFAINEESVFSLINITNYDATFVNPYVGVPVIILWIIFCLYDLYLLFRSKGVVLSWEDGLMKTYRGKRFNVHNIEPSSIKVTGFYKNSIEFMENGEKYQIRLHMVMPDISEVSESLIFLVNRQLHNYQ